MKLRADIDKTSVKYKQYMMKKAALLKIAVFLSALVIGAFVSLLIPLRPEESLTEKRKRSFWLKIFRISLYIHRRLARQAAIFWTPLEASSDN